MSKVDNTQELDGILEDAIYDNIPELNAIYGQMAIDEAKQAILDWHNKQIEAVLDRLKAGISADIPNYYDQDGWEVAMKHIQAERAKLKEVK